MTHRRICERVRLEQTLRGRIQLTDLLAIAAPAAFGQAVRIQRCARERASKVIRAEVRPFEVAGMLSQVGFISLSAATIEKLQDGKPLSAEKQQSVDQRASRSA